jgi:serine palmitoyltransferase
LHVELEETVASFVGKEAAMIFSMGFATNSFGIPSIASKGTLLISDSLNHSSIVSGARLSGASIRVYKHNDLSGLESLLRAAIVDGQERTRRPWKKIIIMVEGIYSMEGEMIDLPGVVALAKRYKAYTYVDEAHSIGALGSHGRGICEAQGVNPSDIDILMGTFTKSFGAMGGYIAGSRAFIQELKELSVGFQFDTSLAPAVAAQVLRSLHVIMDIDKSGVGPDKIKRLRENSNYMRSRLKEIGCQVFGQEDSPIIPIMLYNPTKIAAFSRECLKRGIAVVVVGFPATPLVLSRARFCVSSGHTREDLDYALEKIEEVCDILKLRYAKNFTG